MNRWGITLALLLAMLGTPAVWAQPKNDFAALIAQQQASEHVQAWRRYGFLGIPLVTQAPTIDGVVDEREWAVAGEVDYVLHMAQGVQVHDRASWRLCYTTTHLYLAFQFERPDSARAPTDNDFVEFLFDITHGHQRYHNLGLNLKGKLWSGVGPNVDQKAWQPTFAYQARTTDFGWEGELAIPFAQFTGNTAAPEPGAIWGLDLVRNERTPSDRLAQWAWRGQWSATKDLSHLMFTGQPVAVRATEVGWLPQHKKMGAKLLVSNFGDQSVTLDAQLDLRRLTKPQPLSFLAALDSAFTENLDAAIGVRMQDEISRTLEPYELLQETADRVTLPAQSTRLVELTLPDQPGDYLVGFKLQRDESLLAAMNVPFQVQVPLNISLSSALYSSQRLGYTVDLRRVLEQVTADTALEVRAVLGKDGPVVAQAEHHNLAGKEMLTDELHLEPTSGATYYVTATLRQGSEVIASNHAPLMLPPKPDWIGNQYGRSKFVPAPWHDLRADVQHADTLTIDYTWPGDTLFPTVKVKDQEIFAQPWQLELRDAAGQPVELRVTRFTLESSDIEQAVYTFSAQAGSLGTLTGRITLEFDGFLWYDVTLTPSAPTTLTGCVFTAQLKPRYARIYTRGRIADMPGETPIETPDAGAVPAAGFTMPYTYAAWVGYVEGGLQWYCENAHNWYNADPRQAIAVTPAAAATTLEVRYVDRAVELTKPIEWHFGLMPTPARVTTGGFEDYATFQTGGILPLTPPDPEMKQTDPAKYAKAVNAYNLIDHELKDYGVRNLVLFSYYNDIFGYPGLKDPERRAKLPPFVEHLHQQNVRVLVYAGWGISTECPEWAQFGSELVNIPLKNSGYNTYWASPVSLFPDLFCQRVAEHMREFKLDGIFTDSTLGVTYSEHPNGMRWTDEKGRPRGSYPVRATRDFAKRLYKILNGEVLPHGVFYNHHSPPANVCIENFTNIRCPSEFAQQYDGEFDDAFVDFFLAKNGGIQYGYHVELTNKNWMTRIHKYLNEMNALAIPAGVSFKAVNFASYVGTAYGQKDQPMAPLWAAFRWLDSEKATHYPWWEDDRFLSITPAEGTLSAVWLRPGEKALVCVSNLPNTPRDLTVKLDLGALGLSGASVEDAITGAALTLNGDSVTVNVEPRRWRLLKVAVK